MQERQAERNPLRGGEKAKTRPAMIANAGRTPSRRARTYVPVPHRTTDRSATTFSPSARLPVSHTTGAANSALPIRFSE